MLRPLTLTPISRGLITEALDHYAATACVYPRDRDRMEALAQLSGLFGAVDTVAFSVIVADDARDLG